MKTLKSLIENSNIPAKIIRSVVRGLGGWESFKESAKDVYNHGAAGGYGNFIYHSDTVKFTEKLRKPIVNLVENLAADLGEEPMELVSNFSCLKGDYTYTEVAKALYGRATQDSKTYIYNALAWFALEEVCRAYCDQLEV